MKKFKIVKNFKWKKPPKESKASKTIDGWMGGGGNGGEGKYFVGDGGVSGRKTGIIIIVGNGGGGSGKRKPQKG